MAGERDLSSTAGRRDRGQRRTTVLGKVGEVQLGKGFDLGHALQNSSPKCTGEMHGPTSGRKRGIVLGQIVGWIGL
jgi:hypothetical protein